MKIIWRSTASGDVFFSLPAHIGIWSKAKGRRKFPLLTELPLFLSAEGRHFGLFAVYFFREFSQAGSRISFFRVHSLVASFLTASLWFLYRNRTSG